MMSLHNMNKVHIARDKIQLPNNLKETVKSKFGDVTRAFHWELTNLSELLNIFMDLLNTININSATN